MVPALEAASVPVEVIRTPGKAHAHGLHEAAFERTADFFARHLAEPAG
jgi:hypothetical protein